MIKQKETFACLNYCSLLAMPVVAMSKQKTEFKFWRNADLNFFTLCFSFTVWSLSFSSSKSLAEVNILKHSVANV